MQYKAAAANTRFFGVLEICFCLAADYFMTLCSKMKLMNGSDFSQQDSKKMTSFANEKDYYLSFKVQILRTSILRFCFKLFVPKSNSAAKR